MGSLLRLVALPTVLLLAFLAAEWLRGPLYDVAFEAGNLANPPLIRVGLNDYRGVTSVNVRVEGPVRVTDPAGREAYWTGPSLEALAVAAPAPGPGIHLERTGEEGKAKTLRIPLDEILVVPVRDGTLRVGKQGKARYRGALRLMARGTGRKLTAVNEVGLERYLQGVVASEMWSHWPAPALRAQAVVARTYAAYEIQTGYGRSKRGFDVFDDDNSQVYRGIGGETPAAIDAARATYGVVLLYKGRLFKAFYQNTCGGRTASSKVVFDEQDIPPLGGRPCEYCGHSKHYRWTLDVMKRELTARLFGTTENAGGYRIRVAERSPGGFVKKVTMRSPAGNERTIEGKRFRLMVGPTKFKSLAFDVRDAGAKIVIEGRGWGHLVGLCQEGAYGFVKARPDATYREILSYYYPGAGTGRVY